MRVLALAIAAITLSAAPILRTEPVAAQGRGNRACTTIGDGVLTDSNGNLLTLGFDEFGYNYQAHQFNGTYDSVDRILDGLYWGGSGDYVDDQLSMAWSEDWLSNADCTGDGKLDRGGRGSTSGISRGWTTNHAEGDYDSDGDFTEDAHYTYMVKIAWVGPGGSIWNQYDVIQEIYNDPVGGFHGPLFKAAAPGLGLNDHWTVAD